MAKNKNSNTSKSNKHDGERRDFIVVAANSALGLGAVAAAWPFLDSLSPAADTFATLNH